MLPNWFCKIAYTVWPPILRVLEALGVHAGRQDFLIGRLSPGKTLDDLRRYLTSQGYEPAILAWKDTGEILNMRKIDQQIFQYHLRLFDDGEIRGHYEYSSEGKPLLHCLSTVFAEKAEHFQSLLLNYLR